MTISRQTITVLTLLLLVGYAVMGLEQTANRETLPNKVTVTYWSGWTGDEAETQRKVIRDFNNSQDKIFVKFLSISGLRSKALLSINGGMPPDIFIQKKLTSPASPMQTPWKICCRWRHEMASNEATTFPFTGTYFPMTENCAACP